MSSEQQQQQQQGGGGGGTGGSTGPNNNNNSFRPSTDQHQYENSMPIYPMKQQQMASPITGTVYTGPPAKYLNHTANSYMRPMVTGQKYYNYNGGSMQQQQQQQQQQQRRQNNSTGVENATNDLVNKRKVFVGGLSSETKMEHLRDYFSNFGPVESATVKFDKSGRSKGFGFVLFEDPSVPDKVYAQEVHIIQGKRVDTKSAHRRDQALARKVFVGGLDTEMTDNELREYFSQFGKIAQIEAPIDKAKQKRRPFCFILFENEQSAEDVLKQPRHTIGGKPVDCKRANPKTMENNPQNSQMMAQALAHYSMAGLNQNPYQYAQQTRSQQQLQYQQVALATQHQQQQQQHYSYYNSSSLGQQNNQQGQTRSQSNRQQLSNNNQAWSPISPAQWQGTNYPVDPRQYGSYPTASATGGNGTWQVAAAPHPSQGNSYGQARNQSNNSSNNQGTNSQTGQYSYANWPYNQSQGAMGPNQYNYPTDSSIAAGNAFAAYPPAAGYDHFPTDVVAAAAAAAAAVSAPPNAPPPSQANYNR